MAPANPVIATIADHPAAEVAIGNPAGAGRSRMKQSLLGVAAFAATLAVGLAAEGPARAAPIDPDGALLTDVSFAPYFFGGRQYCWYDSAWSGPGWYWCGYAWRNGLGWGGPRGWHGWHDHGHGGDHFGGDHHGGDHGGAHFAGGVGHVGGGNHFGGGIGHVGGAGGSHFGGGVGHVGGGGGGHFGGGGGGHFGGGHAGGGGGGHAGGGGGGHGGGGHH